MSYTGDISSDGEETSVLLHKNEEYEITVKDVETKDAEKQPIDTYQKNYAKWESQRRKIVFLVAIPAFLPPVMSTMYLPSINRVMDDLDTTEEMIALTVSTYTIVVGILPLIWGSLSDRFGRKTILYTGLMVTIVMSILCGFSWNIYWLIFFRVIQAMGLSSAGVVGAGSIADTHPPEVRGTAMGLFSVTVLIGPVVGPVCGGFIAELFGWRWIFWGVACFAAVFLVLIYFLLPETLDLETANKKPLMLNPFKPLLHITTAPLFIVATAIGFIFGSMFAVTFTYSLMLDEDYDLSESEIGLAYLPFGFGLLAGTFIGGRCADYGYRYSGGGGRLLPTILGTLIFIGGMAAYGFSVHIELWFILITVGIIGFGSTFARPGLQTFAIDRSQGNPAGVTGALFTFSFVYAFLGITLGPLAVDWIGEQWFFLCLAIGVLGILPPFL
eukprot:TRINITY_DN3490_c0_g1_i1.p1 TRINITY_DN3490_c0_g1~~TRINITY_DN3490_c0_g1_i1.p1  ORF type:complete len:442 (+),score=77.01 TRINITY_DN3490_c0_g1_i1:46-1371(+)